MNVFYIVHALGCAVALMVVVWRIFRAVTGGVMQHGAPFERKYMSGTYVLLLIAYLVMAVAAAVWLYRDCALLFGWPPLPKLPIPL